MTSTRKGRRVLAGGLIAAALGLAVLAGRARLPDPLRGDGTAVLLVEFSDYQCPACAAAQPHLKKLLDHYGPKVRFEHKHFPLERIHRWAKLASVAAVCAGRQGRFAPYNDRLFEAQPEWSKSPDARPLLSGYAAALGLDAAAFGACLDDPSAAAEVERDAAEALRLRVNSTPTFFIGGERVAGAGQLRERGALLVERALDP
jgi:protein-disulfide isomerase